MLIYLNELRENINFRFAADLLHFRNMINKSYNIGEPMLDNIYHYDT